MTRLAFLSCAIAPIVFAGPCLAAEPIWSDNFTTLDGWNLQLVSPTGTTRTPAAPCWTVKDHWLQPANLVLRKLDKGMFDVALAKTDAVADCTVRCKVRREPKLQPFGVVLRAKDPANCLVAWITTLETIEIRQCTDGQERTLATAFGYLPAGDGTLEVQADGPRITVLLNGVKSVECRNAPVTSGRCGLIASAATDMNVSSFLNAKPDVLLHGFPGLERDSARDCPCSADSENRLFARRDRRFRPNSLGNADADGWSRCIWRDARWQDAKRQTGSP